MNFRKIKIEEFDKLKKLFPSNDELWVKYRKQRIKGLENNEIDVFVIEDKDVFVGELTINYINHELPTETIPNQRVYLEAFRIDKKYQGNGFGQKLLNKCIKTLINDGYTEFTIGVEDDNEIAKHIYFKYGFTKAIDKGYGDEFDPTDYTLYLKKIEKIDVYNKNKERTGKLVLRERGASLDKGEFIISITAWIVNRNGKILMTKRKLDKAKGGMWEPTTGLVISGETSKQGIIRELKEEIGLELEEKDITLIKEIIEERNDLSFFRDIYLVNKEISLEQLSFNDGEVINAKYVTIDEFNNMIKNGETHQWVDYFNELYKKIKN